MSEDNAPAAPKQEETPAPAKEEPAVEAKPEPDTVAEPKSPKSQEKSSSGSPPTDAQLRAAVKELVAAESGPPSTKNIRLSLEEKFGVPLSERKDLIKDATMAAVKENASSSSSSEDSSSDDSSSDSSAPAKRKRAAPAKRQTARRTQCPISRKEWNDLSGDVKAVCQLGDLELPMTARDFASGNFGWGLYGKHQVKMGGKDVTVSVTCNLTVVNSKDAK